MNIAIIGVGALGKRHLEAVLKSNLEFDVYCIDPFESAIAGIEETYKSKHCMYCGTDINILPDSLDFVVISTTSNVRRKMFDQLVEHCQVKNILFEKVLFQKEEDYKYVQEKLIEYNISAWVNCVRREQESWRNVKEHIKNWNMMQMFIYGSDWGLGCNGIHMLDLIDYLSDANSNLVIDKMYFDNEIIDSKRNGFKEIHGHWVGHTDKCELFTISCTDTKNNPLIIEIIGANEKIIINEAHSKMKKIDFNSSEEVVEEFPMLYVSQTTQIIMESILLNGKCNLIDFNDSCKLHLQMIRPLIQFFEEKGLDKGICPIT